MKSWAAVGIRIIMALGLFFYEPSNGLAVEEIKYQVLETQDPFEIRRYEPFMVAETLTEGDFDAAGEVGFRRLFYFIAGHNRAKASAGETEEFDSLMLPLTAPILQEKANGRYRISLPLPSRYTLPILPEPLDPQVKLREIPARTMAATWYTGTWGQEQYSVQLAKLLDWMHRNGLKGAGEPVYARYDSSYFWFLRRNEVLIPIQRFSPRAADGP